MPRVACIQKFGNGLRTEVMDLAGRYQDILIDAGGRDSVELRVPSACSTAHKNGISPAVFISYTHDSEVHRQNVLSLASNLVTEEGILCEIDQWYEDNTPEHGWAIWTYEQIRKSTFVLIVCTETYKRVFEGDEEPENKFGSKWERSAITQQIYNDEARNKKFLPIIFGSSDAKYIPDILSGTTHYDLSSEKGYDGLCRCITNQPRTRKPAPGRRRQRPPINVNAWKPPLASAGPETPRNALLTGREVEENDGAKPPLETVVGHEVSDYLRRVVCLNQGELPQYSLLANELHRKLKRYSTARRKDTERIRDACQALQEFLNRNLARICDANFNWLQTYFHGRHPIEPRVCLKENIKKGNVIFVKDVRRDGDINYATEHELNSNSGFWMVSEYGVRYQCNNIPERIVSGEYRNARINWDRAKEYWSKRNNGRRDSAQRNEEDSEWVECWDKPRDRNGKILSLHPRSCYKSTLITPMTLWNNELDDSFTNLMIKKGENVARLIFGYLCLDHVQEGYFEGKDENIGYIFADILSLYQLIKLTYTRYSPAVAEAQELLKKARHSCNS